VPFDCPGLILRAVTVLGLLCLVTALGLLLAITWRWTAQPVANRWWTSITTYGVAAFAVAVAGVLPTRR
jgi:hypothetical protein